MPVGRTPITPVPLELPLRETMDDDVVVVVVELTCCTVEVEDDRLDVEVDTVTIVVRCVEEEKTDTVNI